MKVKTMTSLLSEYLVFDGSFIVHIVITVRLELYLIFINVI